MKRITLHIFPFLVLVLAWSCSSRPHIEHPLFTALGKERTGLDFSNDLAYDQQFNLFKYIYFYNGSGIGAGDFNNDGLVDLFFGSNQHSNRIFLNQGGLKFRDVTKLAEIPDDKGWTTGISVVDINNDGLLDIYVCRVGNYETLHSRNQLLINQGPDRNGVPRFKDEARKYGLDFSGFSTQAAFFDYDNDGDLDMFLLNHSVHENGTFRPRKDFAGTYHPLSGDRIYRNDGGVFTNVTPQTGINSTAIGYGLGIALGDLNLDGYPDLYIGNDFHENDYLYINQKDGTFRDVSDSALMHTSQFSMGVDIGDVNNDAFPEIISLDMLPSDPYILKRSLGEDAYDIFQYKISVGYSHQYTRNNLQFNRGDGLFSETGLYSGVAATDWSWAPLWMDFDNDGRKDLFISNGIPKRMNDIDYINFVSNDEVQQKIQNNHMEDKDLSLIEKFPQIKLPNRFFENTGDLSFSDMGDQVEANEPSFSNGAVYADLDNDGDLDIVVNNLNAPVLLYENHTANTFAKSSVRFHFKGTPENINAIGARVVLFAGKEIRTYEKFPVRGFLSSMEIPLEIGVRNLKPDSVFVIWPDRTCQKIEPTALTGDIRCVYRKGLPLFNFALLRKPSGVNSFRMQDLTAQSGLNFVHQENHFVEFDREPLIPHMVSTEGPALAVADINGDGREDVFLGAARDGRNGLFVQNASGRFSRLNIPALAADSSCEDVDACWTDVNRDGFPDLVVASGGNEFYGQDEHNTPRIYLNDGKLHFTKADHPFHDLFVTASCVAPCDFNGDGWMDLFLGVRAVPWEYGQIPRSHFLVNDRKGGFEEWKQAPEVTGFVTSARWVDLDGDGRQDLLLSFEWGGLTAFFHKASGFVRQELTDKKGWWNFVLPCDIDGDGDLDLVAGNLGLNSRLKASPSQPVKLYFNDFDGNGKKEQVVTYYVDGKEIPFASKAELEKQMPALKKKFLYAADFASASLDELFGAEKLSSAQVLTADFFSSAVLINQGGGKFETKPLPWLAQLSPYRDGLVVDANGDALPDILLYGNYYDNNMEMGRYDADYGTLLINRGHGNFEPQKVKGASVKGQVRHVREIATAWGPACILAANNDSARILHFIR